jgi:hypothetical protein
LSYCGLVDARIVAFKKDLPVQDEAQQKLIDDLKRQIEQIKTNEKLLTRYVDLSAPKPNLLFLQT